jgi:hypothetical protein
VAHRVRRALRFREVAGRARCEANIVFRVLRSLHWVGPPLCFVMSLAEIEKAVDELSPKELTKLATYITRRDKLAWDQEIEEDFSPGGKHEKTLEKIDAEIDSSNFTPFP